MDKMADSRIRLNNYPIDAVIPWVDGSDPLLAEKRNLYLKELNGKSRRGAMPTFFASYNEIRYCVISILTFAPFIRNIFIITDGQDPGLYKEVETRFPGRAGCLKIVDHTEIFRGYEKYLPTFNSTSILNMAWRIKELSENFVYFNDDIFLIRDFRPGDWFVNDRPVLRGKWMLPPFRKIAGNYIRIFINRYLLNNRSYQPKLSYYLRQWNAASLLGMKFRYFFHCHTPHPMSRTLLEKFFNDNSELLEKNITDRFRSPDQFLLSALAYHLEIINGNKLIRKLDLGYLHPYYSGRKITRRLRKCEKDQRIRSVCAQSLDMFSERQRNGIFDWVEKILEAGINKKNNGPIDVVIAWVDGNDPRLNEKRNSYLAGPDKTIHSGTHPTRFASVNEIKYCILSIFRFAPFVRNVFIVTDGQDPKLYQDIRTYFPERESSVRIVDHSEIFEGFEEYLPTFNSLTIASMIWRIRGLSDNFVYFNDDTFLIRDIRPEDWFIDGRPVLRGRWVQTPVLRLLWRNIRLAFNRHLLKKAGFSPSTSFHLVQWLAASKLGFRLRYFYFGHTPHPLSRDKAESFFKDNLDLIKQNISHRFRHYTQFSFVSLLYHLEIIDGNRHRGKTELAYLQPLNRSEDYIIDKIIECENDPRLKFICVQSLEMCPREEIDQVFGWMEKILDL